jgi:argininosuccinate lyase
MPFREAHNAVGGVVKLAELTGAATLDQLTLEDLRKVRCASYFDCAFYFV